MLAKSQLPVLAVLTDLPDMLSLAYLREEILACIELDMKSELEVDKQSGASIQIGPHRLTGGADCQWPVESLTPQLQALSSHIDLLEPFDRIREAIREAQRLTESPTDVVDEISDAA